jgi:probable HAF family extracellular repeat protein
MNAGGQIAVGMGDSAAVNVLYSGGTSGSATLLPVLSGATSQFTYGIDNAGEVCGAASPVGTVEYGATVYSGGTQYALQTPPPIQGLSFTSQAEAMSPNGDYTVGQWDGGVPPLSQGQYACLWTANGGSWANGGTFADISGPIDKKLTGNSNYYTPSLAVAVNNSGQVLCTLGGYIGTSGLPAAIYNAASGSITLLGGSFMIGQAPNAQDDGTTLDAGMTQMINDHGQVVGYEVVGGVNHAAIWQNGTVTDLNTAYASTLPAGFVLNDAMAIDDNGDIAGFGTDSAGSTVQAFVLRAPLPGDANLDGRVDINDLTVVLAHFGQSGLTWATGEFTGSGTVDVNDLTIVLSHFGQSMGASAAGALSAVPEPGALALLAAAGLLGVLSYTRRKP